MQSNLLKHYRSHRDNGLSASSALTQARYSLKADDTREQFKTLETDDKVRLRIESDDCADYDNLAGDCFNPDANPSINPDKLKKEEEEFKQRIDNDGVWGVIGEYWDGEQWQQADSCWGFVGDDWKDSGYDVDIMHATINAYYEQQHCPHCHRPIVK